MDNQTTNMPRSSWVKKNLIRLIFVILGAVVLVELVLGIKNFLKPVPAVSKVERPAPITTGKISLVSPQTSYKVGSQIPVSVRVFTGGHTTDGTDLILKYDPKTLEASESSVIKGNIYQEFPALEVNQTTGTVKISGITGANQKGFSGLGNLATVNFKAKAAGATALKVDFRKGATDDSNIIESGSSKDLLGSVDDLTLTINP